MTSNPSRNRLRLALCAAPLLAGASLLAAAATTAPISTPVEGDVLLTANAHPDIASGMAQGSVGDTRDALATLDLDLVRAGLFRSHLGHKDALPPLKEATSEDTVRTDRAHERDLQDAEHRTAEQADWS